MNDPVLFQETEKIKEDLHYYNFIKSIIRLFSVRFRNTVQEIGPYRILDTCGTGGNGIVYRVVNAEDHQQYALKIPYLSYYMIELFDLSIEHMYDDPYEKIDEVTEYFDSVGFHVQTVLHTVRTNFYTLGEERSYRREFYSLKAMKGCGDTVSLCDFGTFKLVTEQENQTDSIRELAFFLVPLFQGKSLAEIGKVENSSLEKWKTALEVLGKAIDIVEEIHQRGVVHRDLHPGNFLYQEKTGELFLIDFGSALADIDLPQDTEGENRGSKRFMAPEQFKDPRCADVRSDFFCIGGLLFFMLTSKSPFSRERQAVTLPPSPGKLISKPKNMTTIEYGRFIEFMERLMSFDSRDRYQTIEEIRNFWEAVLEGVDLDEENTD